MNLVTETAIVAFCILATGWIVTFVTIIPEYIEDYTTIKISLRHNGYQPKYWLIIMLFIIFWIVCLIYSPHLWWKFFKQELSAQE